MINNFSLYLALRYLRPKRTFVSVITVISVLGVTLGVGVLIVVISVMAGFHAQIQEIAKNYDSHIEAFDQYGSSMVAEKKRPADAEGKGWRDVVQAIKGTPGVVSASPMVRGLMLVQSKEGNVAPAMMWGLEQEDVERLIKKYEKNEKKGEHLMVDGSADLREDNIILDQGIAQAWDIHVGDKIRAFSPTNLKEVVNIINKNEDKSDDEKKEAYSKIKEVLLPYDLTVTGIFSPPRLQDSDRFAVCIVPLHVARDLRDMGDGISSVRIELVDPDKAAEIKKQLAHGALPDTWNAFTWVEQHQQLFDTVQNELEMMYFVLFIIVIVAAFCVMNTMITVTVQKRREIGIISALGSRIGQIMWVFLIQGMIVGVVGSLSGVAGGLLVVYYRNDIRHLISILTGQEIFNSKIYGLIEIPAKVVPHDVEIICIGAFLLCTVAALVPALIAARTEPAEALRD